MTLPAEIVAIAHWQVTPQSRDNVLRITATLCEKSLAEPGCLGYEVFSSIEDPGTLLLVERYRDQAALEAHRNSPHYRDLVQRQIIPLLAERRVELLRAQ